MSSLLDSDLSSYTKRKNISKLHTELTGERFCTSCQKWVSVKNFTKLTINKNIKVKFRYVCSYCMEQRKLRNSKL